MKKLPISWLISVGVLVLLVLIFVSFGKNITGAFKRWFGEEQEEQIDHPDTPLPEGEVSPDFDVRSYVARLREVLQFLWDSSVRCDVYERLLELSNPEFVMVCNAYKNEVRRSLRSDMDDQLYDGCNLIYNRHGVEVRERMDDLGVIG